MSDNGYVMGDAPEEGERERLGVLESLYDPGTFLRLQRIGIQTGWRCLEVGAGKGSVVKHLSAAVGAGGRVVATDINPRFLSGMELPNTEVRVHNILTDPLEGDTFDLAHCRLVMAHLRDPGLALRRMVASLRVGGWLLIEESDIGLTQAVDRDHPSAKLFDRLIRLICDAGRKAGTVDPYFGRRAGGLVHEIGLRHQGSDGTIEVLTGGGSGARWLAAAMSVALDLMGAELVGSSAYTQKQLDDFMALFDDPTFRFVGLATFGVWGQKG